MTTVMILTLLHAWHQDAGTKPYQLYNLIHYNYIILKIALREYIQSIKMSNIRNRDLKSKIEKANAGHYYINVTNNDGKFKFSHIKLTGAERMFDRDSNFVYCRPLRHAGNRDELHAFFVSIGSKESEIKSYLQDSYAATNFVKMINEYNREVAKMPSNEPKAKLARTALSLDYIISTSKDLEAMKEENKARVTTPVPRSPKPAANGGKQDLKMRVGSLDDDKVIDITNFDPEKKTGIKTIKKPARGSKHCVGTSTLLKRVYYDFAKPVENGIAALVFLKYNAEKAAKVMNDSAHLKSVDLGSVALK